MIPRSSGDGEAATSHNPVPTPSAIRISPRKAGRSGEGLKALLGFFSVTEAKSPLGLSPGAFELPWSRARGGYLTDPFLSRVPRLEESWREHQRVPRCARGRHRRPLRRPAPRNPEMASGSVSTRVSQQPSRPVVAGLWNEALRFLELVCNHRRGLYARFLLDKILRGPQVPSSRWRKLCHREPRSLFLI